MTDRKIIYDMTAEEYHALQRFSASGIKKILVSAQDFWSSSWMNPDKREYKSDAFNVGTAYHTRILEGMQVFDRRYAIKPECDKRTTAGKQIYANWLLQHPGAEPIDAELYTDILAAKANEIEHFTGGKAEASILWDDEETGVPMKTRLDYLKPGQIVDLKTFSNTGSMDINRLIANHIVKYNYYTQAAVYSVAMPNHDFTFVFQQTGNVNNCLVRKFPKDLLLMDQGQKKMREGINKFRYMFEKYGCNPWYDEDKISSFEDSSFPLWSYDE